MRLHNIGKHSPAALGGIALEKGVALYKYHLSVAFISLGGFVYCCVVVILAAEEACVRPGGINV